MTTTDDSTRRTGAGAAEPFAACVSSIRSALDAVTDTPAWTLSEVAVQDRLADLLGLRARVEELTARLLRSVSEREVPRLAGASSTRAWLMATRGLSAPDASRLVTETAVQHEQPGLGRTGKTRSAWAAGRVSAEQAVLIGRTIDRLSADIPQGAVDRLQVDLVGHAQTLGFKELQKVCRHAVEVVDPDGADQALAAQLQTEEERALAMCELSFRRSGDGWTGFHGRLPDTQADLWKNILDSLTSPRHERAVSPSATDSYLGGGRGDGSREGPSYPQRLGRALHELIEHLPTDRLPQHGANPATLMITMTLDQLKDGLGEALADTGTPVSPGQCRRLACNAALIPVVLGADSAILDLGLSRRLFDRYQRYALAVRDRGCIWPGCDHPSAWCEAHHIIAWAEGGPTDLANGCLLCPFHHHLAHSSEGWQIHLAADGIPEAIPPAPLDTARRPRRHERFARRRC
ncbi:MAG: DUF222 domain-containing protein [Nocardioides sp.]